MNFTRHISILLAALVVLCPLRCIIGGCLANGIGDERAVCSGCCDGCSNRGDDGTEPSPTVPTDCNCRDCFCRGALPVNDVSDDLAVAEFVSFMTFWVKLETTQAVVPQAQVQRNPTLLSFDASAQEVRAALCCWVI